MVFLICLRFSIYQNFQCIRNLNILDFHRVYLHGSYYISVSEYAKVLNLFWKQLQNNIKLKYSGEPLKIRYVRNIYILKPEFFFLTPNNIYFLRNFGKSSRNNTPSTILFSSVPWYFF